MRDEKSRTKRARALAWLEDRINLTEIFALVTSLGLFYVEVDKNKPLGTALREALEKPMASYARWPRVLAPLAVLFFLFQGVTGVLLAFYYRASPAEAHESIRLILRDVSFGWLIHQVHRWGGQILVVILVLRMVRFFFEGVYKKPRELLWVSGALLGLAGVGADLTGRLLPWNQVSYWTTVRALELVFMLPLVGPLLAFLFGGQQITAFLLSRFYFLHVAALPALVLALFYLNFATVRRVGLTVDVEEPEVSGRRQYRSYLYNLLILVALILGALVSLAVLLPVPFRPQVDPFSTPSGIGPPWYFLAPHALAEILMSWLPDTLKGTVLLVGLLLLVFWPFVDRTPATRPRDRKAVIAFGVFVLLLWLGLSLYGFLAQGGRFQ